MRWTDTLEIHAPGDVVWALNTDVEQWPTRTPTMQSVQRLDRGPFQVGSQARIKQPGQPLAVWTVTRLRPGHEFSWQTVRRGLVLIGTHRVDAAGDGSRNTLQIDATGPLSRPFGLLFGAAVRRALRTENAGFKTAAEQQTSTA